MIRSLKFLQDLCLLLLIYMMFLLQNPRCELCLDVICWKLFLYFCIKYHLKGLRTFKIIESDSLLFNSFFLQFICFLSHLTVRSKKKSGDIFKTLVTILDWYCSLGIFVMQHLNVMLLHNKNFLFYLFNMVGVIVR